MMRLLKLAILFLVVQTAHAQQGGMWLPHLLSGQNEKEMKSLGMKMSAKDIYDVNHSSLKDAIAHFDGGCTSEVISPKGLLLTNHHCGYDNIQSHSSVEKDFLTNGFWAYSLAEELPNPGMVVTFVISIEDVTDKVLAGTEAIAEEANRQEAIQKNISALTRDLPKQAHQENRIRAFYEGNQYLRFVTETFRDIRLVGAPPSSIGKFGSDTDNWVWPRHTGDFALFRIYADKDNKPADYSTDNVPYTPKHFLPISLSGVAEDDFTMVFGFPGRTTEYLPAVAVEQLINELNPAKIAIRDAALKVTDGFMRRDPAIKIQYASKFASIANYWKKWIGETQGLKKSNAVGVKKQQEAAFRAEVNKKGKQQQYGHILTDFEKHYTDIAPYALSRDIFMEVALRNTELLTVGFRLYQLEQIFNNRGEQSFNDRRNNLINGMDAFYKNYNKNVDEKVFEQLVGLYSDLTPEAHLPESLRNIDATALTAEVYGQTALADYESFKKLLSGDNPAEILKRLNEDPAFRLTKQMADAYFQLVAPQYETLNLKISELQRNYTKALLELQTVPRMFPDANGTLRVTYGKVKGYAPKDATYYHHITYLDGVMEKYVPGDYEFDVPEKLIELYEKKDFGPYAENGRMPVNFIGTNHTTGGNSGSPAIDAHGNLIGLNFDRVWEGTMSDVYYDPAICRNIMVDIRYVLFIIDKYADAQNIISELKLVHSKKKSKRSK